MADSDNESANTDELLSGIYPLNDVSPISSPVPPKVISVPHSKMSQLKSGTATPENTSNSNSLRNKPGSPSYRTRSVSPLSRIRVHYTDSAREALDLANKSYERLLADTADTIKTTILLNPKDSLKETVEKEKRLTGAPPSDRSKQMVIPKANVTEALTVSGKLANGLLHSPRETDSLIQEHIRFAESILASPTSSDSERRSRSLSPSPRSKSTASAVAAAHFVIIDNRSRSSSPSTKTAPHITHINGSDFTAPHSRKKLSFDRASTDNVTVKGRQAREAKIQEIRTKVMNDYVAGQQISIPADPSHVYHEVSVTSDEEEQQTAQPFKEIPVTPDKGQNNQTSKVGPMSSTPHKPGREPLRELSPIRLFPDKKNLAGKDEEFARTTPQTPSTYIKGLQSVRVGLKQLMEEDFKLDQPDTEGYKNGVRSDDINHRIQATINAENQLLRDQLNRERSLRKQIELDKQELQNQLLESKDKLHHMSSILKQKDEMMKKLDQNLESVVSGWQKHEQENKEHTDRLMQKIKLLEKELNEQQRHAASLESELLAAVDELKREQDSSKEYVKGLSDQQAKHSEQVSELKQLLAQQRENHERLEIENKRIEEGRSHVTQQLESLQETLNQERTDFKDREEELLNKINEITNVQIAVLEKEAIRAKEQAIRIEELTIQLKKYETELEAQRHILTTKTKEIERLQSHLELTEAKHENNVRQVEAKLRLELELRISQAKDDALKKMADNELGLQQAHQRQVSEIMAEHNRQMGEMKERFRNELNRVKSYYEQQLKSAESSLQEGKTEMDTLVAEKNIAETQRNELSTKLNAILTLLGSGTTGQLLLPKNGYYVPSFSNKTPGPLSKGSSERSTYSYPTDNKKGTDGNPSGPSNEEAVKETKPAQKHLFEATDKSTNSGDKNSPSLKCSTANSTEISDHSRNHDQEKLPANLSYTPSTILSDQESQHYPQTDSSDSVAANSTHNSGFDEQHQRRKRQSELQDYIKKLLNRSVGEPLVETRLDLDHSHISIISGLDDGNFSPQKAVRLEVVGHTPPIKGSTKKTNPKEIAELLTKYGEEKTIPETDDYLKYLKTVNKAASERHSIKPKDLTKSFTAANAQSFYNTSNNSDTSKHSLKDSTGSSIKSHDRKVKRHQSHKVAPVWK